MTLKDLGYSLNEEDLLNKLTDLQKQREENRKIFPKEENVNLECQIEEDEEQENRLWIFPISERKKENLPPMHPFSTMRRKRIHPCETGTGHGD